MAKKTVIVEESQDDALFHPRVIAKAVDELKQATAEGFRELKSEIHNQSANFATQAALLDAKREAELEHEKIIDKFNNKTDEALREAKRANRVIARVGWVIIYAVLLAVLAIVGLNVAGVHH
jgi:CHASE3 domain sensor protein